MRLDEMFRADAHPDKINLVVGVYQTDRGTSPVLDVVKEAERRLVGTETSKVYVPMAGEKPFLTSVEQLIFGGGSALLRDHRVASVHAPGGTAALRLAAEFIAEAFAGASVWIGDPAYPNHRGIFGALGIACKSFRYFDPMRATILEGHRRSRFATEHHDRLAQEHPPERLAGDFFSPASDIPVISQEHGRLPSSFGACENLTIRPVVTGPMYFHSELDARRGVAYMRYLLPSVQPIIIPNGNN